MSIIYCAICTSTWCQSPDESFHSENFNEALSFCTERIKRLKAFEIIKSESNGDKEEVIISFRSVK